MATQERVQQQIEEVMKKIEKVEREIEDDKTQITVDRDMLLTHNRLLVALNENLTLLLKEKNKLAEGGDGSASTSASTDAAGFAEVMQTGFKNMVAALKAPNASRVALPSGLSSISQGGWKLLQEDFQIQVMALQKQQLQAVKTPPDIAAYEWKAAREDEQKQEYMKHIKEIIPPGENAEWVQGDQYDALLIADQVHKWSDEDTEQYRLCGTPDAAVILTPYRKCGLPWEGIRLTVELKKKIVDKSHYEAGAQLILANISSGRFKPMSLLTDLNDEWHLKYMSGNTMYTGQFPSRAAAVAFIKTWLQKETVSEQAVEGPLAITGPSDDEGLGPMLKRARYVHRYPVMDSGDTCITDLADCLPKEEAREVLALAALKDLRRHYRIPD